MILEEFENIKNIVRDLLKKSPFWEVKMIFEEGEASGCIAE